MTKDLGYEHLCLPMEFEPDHPFPSTRFADPRSEPGELLCEARYDREAVEDLKKLGRPAALRLFKELTSAVDHLRNRAYEALLEITGTKDPPYKPDTPEDKRAKAADKWLKLWQGER